jgi:hypothetical protein
MAKIIDINHHDAADIRRGVERARRIVAAVLPALQEVDRQLSVTQAYIADVESKAFWGPEVEYNED